MEEVKALLNEVEPIEISVENKNFWQRIGLRKSNYTIELKPVSYGVMLQVTKCLMEIDQKECNSIHEIAKYISGHEEIVTRMIAYVINAKPESEPPAYLKKFIRKNIMSNQITNIVMFVINKCDLANFMLAINLVTQRLVATKDLKAGQKS